MLCSIFTDGTISLRIKCIEKIILNVYVLICSFFLQKIGAELYKNALVFHGMIKKMNLARRKKEKCIFRYRILLEVNSVCTTGFTKPYYLVKCMDMRRVIVHNVM